MKNIYNLREKPCDGQVCQKQQKTLHYQNKAHLSNVAKYLSLFLLGGKEITHRGGRKTLEVHKITK